MKTIILKTFIILIVIIQTLFGQIKFAWITDTHIGSPGADNDLIQIVNDINQRELKFTIITGDITEKGLNSELNLAKQILDNLKNPYFIIPGNHDTKWSESGCTKFSEIFGDNKFFFFNDEYCFVGLNSGIPLRGGGGHIAIEDLQWLKAKLNKQNPDTKIIFAVHHQLDNEVDNHQEVIDIFSKFKKVFVIVGHGHSNKAYQFNSIKGAMGRSALSKGKNPGYNIVTLFGDSISIQTNDFDKINEWYRNSIYKLDVIEKDNLSKVISNKSKLIFDSKTTLVKTGIAVGKNFCFADLSGNIYSIQLNGKLNWSRYIPTSFFAKPVAYKNQIIFCGTDGKIYFLSNRNGKILKVVNLNSAIIATPVIHKKYLILFTNDGKMNFIDLKDLDINSFKVAEKNFETIPLLFDHKIFIGNWDNYLYSLNTNPNDSLLINWKWTENKNFYYSPAASSPLVDNHKRIFISTPDKFISAIELSTGKTLIRTNEFNSWESIGIDEARKLLLIKGLVDTLYAIDIENQVIKLKWKVALEYGLDTNPIPITEKSGLIFVPAKNGNLYIVKKQNGELVDKIFLGNARLNDIVLIDNNNLIVSNMDGKIFRIKLNQR